MHVLLTILGIFSIVIGVLAFSVANGAIQEIFCGVILLIGVQFFVGGAVTNAIYALKKSIDSRPPSP